MNTPARGPQPILRANGTTTTSSGTIHTLLILAADKLRPRTIQTDTKHAANTGS